MLKHLGFKVLAEGVETKEQLDMLRLADCDIVQGYFMQSLCQSMISESFCRNLMKGIMRNS